MSDSELSTSSETSPTTKRWNKVEQSLNETKATTHEELVQKLRQKIMVKQMRRLPRDAQNTTLDNIKQEMIEKQKATEEEVERSQIKKDKLKEKKKKYKQRKKQKNSSSKLNIDDQSNDDQKDIETIITNALNAVV